MDEKDLLTVREVARACKRSEETVRRWIWSGKLPARKIGNQHFIGPADLRAIQAGQSRLAEPKAEYRVGKIPLDHPLSDGRGGYDREKALKLLREMVAFANEVAKDNPPFDVTEAMRELREGQR